MRYYWLFIFKAKTANKFWAVINGQEKTSIFDSLTSLFDYIESLETKCWQDLSINQRELAMLNIKYFKEVNPLLERLRNIDIADYKENNPELFL